MARRNPFRTPEDAWYHNYEGRYDRYRNHNYAKNRHHGDSQAFGSRDRDRYTMTEYHRNGALGNRPPLYDRQHHQAERFKIDTNDHGSYGKHDEFGGGTAREKEWQYAQETQGGYNNYNDCGMHQEGTKGGHRWDEWEPEFTPRRTTYDPSFHQAPASPRRMHQEWHEMREREREMHEREREMHERERQEMHERERQEMSSSPKRVLPWERDRQEVHSSCAGREDEGQGRWDGSDRDQTNSKGMDPRMGKVGTQKPIDIFPKTGSGAFLFVRFPVSSGDNLLPAAKACLLAKTSDMGGRFVGITPKVHDFGYPKGPDEGCAVFQFPTLRKAELFFQYDKRIRQPDFPPPQGHPEVFAISLQCDPNVLQTFDTFLLSEITLKHGLGEETVAEYTGKYIAPFTEYLKDSQVKVMPYAAFSTSPQDRKSLRRHFFSPNTVLTLHMFGSTEDLDNVMKKKEYKELRCVHNSMATEKCSVFTINRQACP